MKKFRIDWTNNSIKYLSREKKAIIKSLDDAIPFTQGKYLNDFEKKFKKYLTSKSAYAVSNGSNALDLSAILIDTNPEDEIIVPAHTWCASAISFARFGAKIIWADINPSTLVISIDSIKKLVTKNTKAIIVVHLYGVPADMKAIMTFAKKNKIIIIEDCAQALGASIGNKKVGTFGDISIFSFHSNKIITTLGEGGMLVVNNSIFNKNISALRHNGVYPFKRKKADYYWKPAMTNIIKAHKNYWPHNYCLGEIQCAIGAELLKRVDSLNRIRIKRAIKFKKAMKKFPELIFQKTPKNYKNVYHCLVASYFGKNARKKRDLFIKTISKKYEIKAIVQNCPLNRYPLFKKFKSKYKLKNTDNFFDTMISWPFYTYMSEKNFDYMISSTQKVLLNLRNQNKY